MNAFGVAWWNAGVVPARGAPHTERWPAAQVTLQQLFEDGAHVVGVGELSERFADDFARGKSWVGRLFRSTGNRSGRQLGFFYRKDLVEMGNPLWISNRKADPSKPTYGVGATFAARARPSAPLAIVAVHWPSRLHESAREARGDLAHELRDLVDKLREKLPTIVMGDFNDEPFDLSIATGLKASRDRALVAADRAPLYNPFWRLLGERQHLEQASSVHRGAGTYFYRGGSKTTDWYTFDQIMFSRHTLVGELGWRLREERVHIVTLHADSTNRSDHCPVFAEMESMQ